MLALAAVVLAAHPASAQQPRAAPLQRAFVAATEDRLWTARIENGRTFLSCHDRSGESVTADPLNARIVALAAAGQQAYTFQEDGSFFRFADEWSPALDLPERQVPVALTALDGVPYALVPSEIAAELPASGAAGSAATSRVLSTASAPLTLVRYDQRGWSAVAACPADVPADAPYGLRPRLCATHRRLMLFSGAPRSAHSPQREQLDCWTFEPGAGRWIPGPPARIPAGVTAFWPVVVNRLPTLVLYSAEAGGDHLLRFLRLMEEDAGRTWEPASLDLSPLPDATPATPAAADGTGTSVPLPAGGTAAGSTPATADRPDAANGQPTPVDACGFNQHLGVQVELPNGANYLRFGRFEGPATLDTLDLLAKPPLNVLPTLLQALRAAVMLGILVALFVFRRGSLVAPFPLARGLAPAFVLQRLAATLIDLVPFAALAALVLQLDWAHALNELGRLLSDSQATSRMPSGPIILWLLLSAGTYALYCLIMELLAGRTLGKMLVGLHVVAEQGGRARPGCVVVRNLFRAIEVLPPFWLLIFVMILSRNRQRVGDIFARTIVVRQISLQPDSKQE